MALIQTCFALLLNALVEDLLKDESVDVVVRSMYYNHFGTYGKAMLSMWELALANWAPIVRFLHDEGNRVLAYISFGYVLLVNFAIVRVISGVFLSTTFQVAATDDTLMMVQKQRAAQSHAKKMASLFRKINIEEGDAITRDVFVAALSQPDLRLWLSSMDIEAGDAEALFDLLDNNSGALTLASLSDGIARLKGVARNIDLVSLQHRTYYIQSLLQKLVKHMSRNRCTAGF